jgi:molybdopterin converting factor small subunit
MPLVRVYGHIAKYTGREFSMPSRNIKELLEDVVRVSGEDVREIILDKEGKPKDFIRIYVNQTDIRFLSGLETELSLEDIVTIMPALAGG